MSAPKSILKKRLSSSSKSNSTSTQTSNPLSTSVPRSAVKSKAKHSIRLYKPRPRDDSDASEEDGEDDVGVEDGEEDGGDEDARGGSGRVGEKRKRNTSGWSFLHRLLEVVVLGREGHGGGGGVVGNGSGSVGEEGRA